MSGPRCLLGILLFSVALAARPDASGQSPSPSEVTFAVAPAPAWVKPVEAPSEMEPGNENSGLFFLLVDRQENLERNAFYYHEVRQLKSENGVQNGAAISVSFNPAFERLTFHSVELVRDGVVSNRLDRSQIRLSQNAKDPDRLRYDSSCSADLVLEDVRAGDLIEFSYTREGRNPLKQGKPWRRIRCALRFREHAGADPKALPRLLRALVSGGETEKVTLV